MANVNNNGVFQNFQLIPVERRRGGGRQFFVIVKVILSVFFIFSILVILSNCMELLDSERNPSFLNRIEIVVNSSYQIFALSFFYILGNALIDNIWRQNPQQPQQENPRRRNLISYSRFIILN